MLENANAFFSSKQPRKLSISNSIPPPPPPPPHLAPQKEKKNHKTTTTATKQQQKHIQQQAYSIGGTGTGFATDLQEEVCGKSQYILVPI